MKKLILMSVILLSFTAGALAGVKEPKPEILGISIGMDAEAAHDRLRKMGKLQKEERKQQEIWMLKDDPRFDYLIVGFDKQYKQVRYVTAKAREKGTRMRYTDVLDVKSARQTIGPNTYKYAREVAAGDRVPGYTVVVRGSDPQFLTYYSIEVVEQPVKQATK